MDERRRCTAKSSRTGAPCKKFAIHGGTVCATHGGSAPQVKAAAEARLKELQDPAIEGLRRSLEANTVIPRYKKPGVQELVEVEDNGTRLRAQLAVLDRTGLGPTKRLDIGGTDGPPIKIVLGVEEGAV